MGVFDSVVNNILNFLKQDKDLSGIDFVIAFRPIRKANPLLKPLVTVGLSGVEINNQSMGGYLGLVNNNEVYGKSAKVSCLIKIHCPVNLGGEKCIEVFSQICNSLVFKNLEYQIEDISCKDIDHVTNGNCYTLDCVLKVNTFVTESEEELPISNIVVKGEI